MSSIPESNSDEFSENVFKNFNSMFFEPEVEKRKRENLLPLDFKLLAAQVIFSPKGEPPIVRLNEEVNAIVKVKKGVDFSEKDYWASIEEVETVRLNEKEYKDCGHVTMILFKDGYQLTFDFRYNSEVSRKHLDLAKEFLASAEYSFRNNYYSAFIDNSFSVVELLAKCRLLLATNRNVYGKTNHKSIKSEFNKFYQRASSSWELDEREALNKLSSLRNHARYLNGDFEYPLSEMEKILQTLKTMYNAINEYLS